MDAERLEKLVGLENYDAECDAEVERLGERRGTHVRIRDTASWDVHTVSVDEIRMLRLYGVDPPQCFALDEDTAERMRCTLVDVDDLHVFDFERNTIEDGFAVYSSAEGSGVWWHSVPVGLEDE